VDDVEALSIALGGFGRRGERERVLCTDGIGSLRRGEVEEERAVVLLQWLGEEEASRFVALPNMVTPPQAPLPH